MRQTTYSGTRKSTGPPPGAAPCADGLPVAHVAGQPAPTPLPVPEDRQWPWASFWALFLLRFAGQALDEWSSLTMLQSYVAVYALATVFGYWVGERPRQSFVSWALKVIGIYLNGYVAFVTLPASLRELIPEPLAYGLPAYLVLLIFYWVPPLKPGTRGTTLRFWVLWSMLIAAAWGWAGPSLVK